jgi:hypothetical protein
LIPICSKEVTMDPDKLAELRRIVDGKTWIFAKTMPQWPHWYIVRSPAIEDDYATLFAAIQEHGTSAKFKGVSRKYLRLDDGFKYWAMTTHAPSSRIINRDEVTD